MTLYIPEVAEPLAEGLKAGVGVKGRRQNPNPRRLRYRLRVRGVWRQEEAEGNDGGEPDGVALQGGLLGSAP
jgi:hypothetical protein